MKNYLLPLIFVTLFATNAFADTGHWYLKPSIGISGLSNTSGMRIDEINSYIAVTTEDGFSAGIGLGYAYNRNLSAEVSWEYRSNDTKVNLSDGSEFPDGNYASSLFFVNGVWHFNSSSQWRPYVGGGIVYVQEIDIDLESAGVEQSFSDSGQFGLQVFGGIDYKFTENITFGGEVRYFSSGMDNLQSELPATGSIEGLEYDTWTIGVTMTYHF